MRTLEQYHPITIALYFFMTAGVVMFSMHPVLLVLSLLGAIFTFLVQKDKPKGGHGMAIALFFVIALLNPLISHNGVTVLFVVNHNPITAEAFYYGIAMATAILAVLYWFRTFTHMMTSDKLLCLFGALSPKLALVLSMGLRYVPLFQQQWAKVEQAQKGLGKPGKLRVFFGMVTWVLENGIITADSMAARGYGTGKRSHFSIFHFSRKDGILLGIMTAFFALTCIGLGSGSMAIAYYPAVVVAKATPWTYIAYVAYGILALLPTFLEVEETLKWNYLQRSI